MDLSKHYRSVLAYSRPVLQASEDMHLSHITRAIEHCQGCKIILNQLREGDPRLWAGRGIIISFDVQFKFMEDPDQDTREFLQHYLFYKDHPDDKEVTFFRVAYLLAHCILDWPLDDRENRIVKVEDYEPAGGYYIEYIHEEKERAAALAVSVVSKCLMNKDAPRGHYRVFRDRLIDKLDGQREFEFL